MSAEIDPITLEVVCEGLISIVREMRASIIRASYSSVIYELDDFSCALFNAAAEMVAQSDDHPGHVLPMPWSVRCAMEDFEGDIEPGDIILLNDAYRGGTHLNDVTLLYPVFEGEELILLPAVRAHWADVGGMTPGSYSGLATSIFQEGLRIPPLKLYQRGVPNRGVMALIECNMRLPEHRLGDLKAMIGACRVAEARLGKLFGRYGRELVLDCVARNLDRCEARMRERIATLPDGTYVYEDYLEYFDDGRFDPVLMRLALTIDGDQVTADFEGSNPQVPGVVNSSLAVAGAGVFVALKSTLDPGGAVNHGVFRPITLKAPEASIVDVRPDAPAGAHGEVRKRAISVMLGCLSQIIPEAVSGDLCGTSFPNSIGGRHAGRDREYVYVEVPAGGNGGFEEADGSSAFVNVDFGNIRSIHTAEQLENEMPLLVERSVLRPDSGGPGASRGGLGMSREVRLLDGEAIYSVLSDRAVIPPFGVLGGASAAPVRVAIESDGSQVELATPGKATGHTIRQGDIVVMQSAGGGGYGDPLTREPERVAEDVRAGYVSAERAPID
ncbi:MAG: hydantoinase B/oxoprolinase family protein, partial [Alphaproteobacteria bacterium]|nr:hydantoinase B/oxoprolinase family protein [Alphaproteobacteria bacterium]